MIAKYVAKIHLLEIIDEKSLFAISLIGILMNSNINFDES
jgi:hypothetical protein